MISTLARIQSEILLAGGDFKPRNTRANESAIQQSSLWGFITSILFLVGAGLGVFGFVKFVGKIGGGKIGEAAKTLVATVFGCAFLFNPDWVFRIFEIAGNLMGSVLDTFGTATSDANKVPAAPAN